MKKKRSTAGIFVCGHNPFYSGWIFGLLGQSACPEGMSDDDQSAFLDGQLMAIETFPEVAECVKGEIDLGHLLVEIDP